MNYGNIKYFDIADGAGVRTSLFVSGCTHHCKGCFQPETWDFSFGKEFTVKEEDEIIASIKDTYVEGLTLLGGEPFEPENQAVLLPFLRFIGQKDIIAKPWEELTDPGNKRCHTENTLPILSLLDVLVDGEFHEEEKSLMLRFKGSANQRVLDVKRSLKEGRAVPSVYNEREKN